MLYHFENKNEQGTINSKADDLLKFKEVIKDIQQKIVVNKSDKYNFDFGVKKLTAIKEIQSGIFSSTEKSQSDGKNLVDMKKIHHTGGTVVNKYKEKLQKMLGKKLPRNEQVQMQ